MVLSEAEKQSPTLLQTRPSFFIVIVNNKQQLLAVHTLDTVMEIISSYLCERFV